ncbi:MAG TPA: EAL domain-containing protein [Steroidobacteraceae bacterium]|nr:EAL domain-containing protein [Steroidobacteraceae bacterium]
MQPLKAMAARPPVITPAAASAAPAAPEPVTAESLGWQLRAALPPLRLHSVSLYDDQANVLWLSEGALGPDEHNLVVDAIESLTNDRSLPCYENGLEDGRAAIFLPVRSPQADLVGVAMILADMKSVGDGILERTLTPQMRTIVQKIAVLMRSTATTTKNTIPTIPAPAAQPTRSASAQLKPSAPTAAAQPNAAQLPPAPAPGTEPPLLSPQAINDILEFELSPDVASAGNILPAAAAARSTGATTTSRALPSAHSSVAARPSTNSSADSTPAPSSPGSTTTSRSLAIDPSSIILDLLPFSRLRAGGRMRRYEVLPRIPNRAPAALDSLALQRLVTWLGSNRAAWNLEPTSFSLNLSITTLEDDRFLQQVASCLKSNGIAAENIGFEIAEPLCTQRRAQVERFISLCDKLGCFVVIDDFSFDSAVLPLLRSKAVRLVKIDPKLTSAALRDKLSQAMVVAIVQAVKVLGIHCAAKRVEAQASLQWLTAIGCDLAQGAALSQPLPIESLNMPQGGG